MSETLAYPRWLRWWHWTNAVLFVTSLVTGLRIHYSGFHLPPFGFRADMLIHNSSGILLTLSFFVYLYGNLRLGNGRFYRIALADFHPGLVRQARYYLYGIFRGEPHPFPHSGDRKFNPMQKLGYLKIMYVLFPILAVTGWALLLPDRLPERTLGIPGITLWALVHTYLGFFFSLFLVVHVYLGTTGATPTEYFRLMWSGESKGLPPAPPGETPA